MNSMQQFNQGEIVIIEYPFSDGSGAKMRPVVIVSNEFANINEKDLVFAKITTNQRGDNYSLPLLDSDTVRPLPKNSEVRANKFYTLDQSLI
jgi:mRNA interferase MazF